MEVFDAIEKRHSYRKAFKPDPVPKKDIARIVDAGIKAPSGYNAQTTSFVIVDEKDLIGRIAAIVGKESLIDTPVIVVVIMGPPIPEKNLYFGIEDYSAAAENILLAVTALGYATVWIDGVLRSENRAEQIGELLGVPDDHEVRVILPIGIPAEEGAMKEKKSFSERAWFNHFAG